MKKTSLYLPPELDEALARRAADEGLTKAELIRRTLEGAMQRPKRPKAQVGAVTDAPPDLSRDVDGHLRRGGFGRS